MAKNIFEEYKRRVRELSFLDCNAWVGEPDFPTAQVFGPEALFRHMQARHTRGGLISHWAGLTLSPQRGNALLLEIADSLPELWRTVLTGLPLYPPDVGYLPGQEKPHPSAAGVRLFPRSHSYALKEWVIGSLIDWMEHHGLALFLWHTEIDWDDLHILAAKHPKLPIVLETQREKILYHMRMLCPLMRDCGNICVETSNLAGQGYLEYLVREFGAERVLYGSFFPVNDPTVAQGMLLDADIKKREKELVASENLLRILDGAGP